MESKTKPSVRHPFRTAVICEHEKHKNRGKFNPDKDFIKNAVQEYLAAGGKVTTVNPADRKMIDYTMDQVAVHEWLNDNSNW